MVYGGLVVVKCTHVCRGGEGTTSFITMNSGRRGRREEGRMERNDEAKEKQKRNWKAMQ